MLFHYALLSFDINAFFTVSYNQKVSKFLLYREILRLLYHKSFQKKKVFRGIAFIQMSLNTLPTPILYFSPVTSLCNWKLVPL